MKTCTMCQQEKALAEFSKAKHTKDGHAYWCKTCFAKYNKHYRKENTREPLDPELKRQQNVKKLYGITLDAAEYIFFKQGNACAICKTEEPGGNGWHIDHNHETSYIRGILCHRCNVGIGFLRDDVQIVRNAVHYLANTQEFVP